MTDMESKYPISRTTHRLFASVIEQLYVVEYLALLPVFYPIAFIEYKTVYTQLPVWNKRIEGEL